MEFGLIVNEFSAMTARKYSSPNKRVIRHHLMEDSVGWVAVMIGYILMHLSDVPWLPPFVWETS
jgi:cobalt-zinc-cadmium efflux system protein